MEKRRFLSRSNKCFYMSGLRRYCKLDIVNNSERLYKRPGYTM